MNGMHRDIAGQGHQAVMKLGRAEGGPACNLEQKDVFPSLQAYTRVVEVGEVFLLWVRLHQAMLCMVVF